MKLEIQSDIRQEVIVVVTLSRRNLNVLLAKLDGHPPQSACTITNHGGHLIVKAEEDGVHYKDRVPPGRMHPHTEAEL